MRVVRVLRHPHIAVLWLGLLLSAIGDCFYGIALMWIGVRLVGNAVGLVAGAQHVATLAFGLVAGVYVDRWNRRWTMIVADLVRAGAVATVPLFAKGGDVALAHLVVVAVVLGAFTVLFQPALQASLPNLVERPDELNAANALVDATFRVARAVGPSLAGLVAARIALHHFFTLDAVSFALSAAAVLSIGGRFAWRAPEAARGAARSVAREIAQAFAFVRASAPFLWSFGSLFAVNAAWAAAFAVGAPLLAADVLHADVGAYGLIIGAYGLGNVTSNLVFGSVRAGRPIALVFWGKIVLGAGFLVLASAKTLPVALIGASVAAVGGPMEDLSLFVMIQTECPGHQMGKLFALRMITESGGFAFGLAASKILYDVVSVPSGIAIAALLHLALGAAGLRRFRLR